MEHDPATVEALARQLCMDMDIDPNAFGKCDGCPNLHPLWESMAPDAEFLLSALRTAGYSVVKFQ